jgi:hypothetical protein
MTEQPTNPKKRAPDSQAQDLDLQDLKDEKELRIEALEKEMKKQKEIIEFLMQQIQTLQETVKMTKQQKMNQVPLKEQKKSYKEASIPSSAPVQPSQSLKVEEWEKVEGKQKKHQPSKPKVVPISKPVKQPSTLKAFLDRSPSKEEILKALLKTPKKPEERSSNIISIFVRIPMKVKAMQDPILAWKQFLKAKECDLPLSISLINPCTAELFYEESSLHQVLPVLKAENYLLDQSANHLIYKISEKDLIRRADAYLRGYFRPLRLAALVGFNLESQKKVLLLAKERLEKKFVDKFSRQQWRYHVQKDMDHIVEVESAQMSEDS